MRCLLLASAALVVSWVGFWLTMGSTNWIPVLLFAPLVSASAGILFYHLYRWNRRMVTLRPSPR